MSGGLLQLESQLKQQGKQLTSLHQENDSLQSKVTVLKNQNKLLKEKQADNKGEITRLKACIAEKEDSRNQMSHHMEQLRKLLTQQEENFNRRRKQEMDQEIERHKQEISQLKEEMTRADSQIIDKTSAIGALQIQSETLPKVQQKAQKPEGDPKSEKRLVSLKPARSIESEQPPTIGVPVAMVRHADSRDIFESQVQPSTWEEWRYREFEWEKIKMKFETEITKLKSKLYNAEEVTAERFRAQCLQYDETISGLNDTIEQLNQKVSESAQKKDQNDSTNFARMIQLEKKLKKAKSTINRLKPFQQMYQNLQISNIQYKEEITNLAQELIEVRKQLESKTQQSQLRSISPVTSVLRPFTQMSSSRPNGMHQTSISTSPIINSLRTSVDSQKYKRWLVLQQQIQRLKQENSQLKGKTLPDNRYIY